MMYVHLSVIVTLMPAAVVMVHESRFWVEERRVLDASFALLGIRSC
jgi:hypothetical protein